jgi:hypothetical protein
MDEKFLLLTSTEVTNMYKVNTVNGDESQIWLLGQTHLATATICRCVHTAGSSRYGLLSVYSTGNSRLQFHVTEQQIRP